MATIKGIWVFNGNPVLSGTSDKTYSVNFTSNGTSYTSMVHDYVSAFGGYWNLKYESTWVYSYDPNGDANGTHWSSTNSYAYKTVDFGATEQTVTDAFKSWMEANATEQKATPTVTYDLTQLNLDAGTHTITVIGKAGGYKASAASEGVSYTVEAKTVTISAGTYVCADLPTGDAVTQELNFVSDGTSFTKMKLASDGWLYYGTWVVFESGEGWSNTAYKTITLATDQTVSAEFGEWFNSNFTAKQSGYTVVLEYEGDGWCEVEINGQEPETLNLDMAGGTTTYNNVETIKLYVATADHFDFQEGTGSLANYVEGTTVTVTEDSYMYFYIID